MRKTKPLAINQPEDFTAPCGCKVRFDNDGLVRMAQCPLHAMASDLHDVLLAIVTKSTQRPGDEECSVHPKLIEAGRMMLHNLKVADEEALPEICYGLLESQMLDRSVRKVKPIVIKRGEGGYHLTDWEWTKEHAREALDKMNSKLGVTPKQADIMISRSMFKWPKPKSV